MCYRQLSAEIIKAGRTLYDEGLIVAGAGNLSSLLDDGSVLCTPAGVSKGHLTPEIMLRVNLDGEVLDKNDHARPSSELHLHLALYQASSSVGAVVHAHPPTATALSHVPGLNLCVTAEGAAILGPVAQIAYRTPGTVALGELCAEAAAKGATTFLLANHGAACVGKNLQEAMWRMSSLEHVARIWMTMHQLGSMSYLDDTEVKRLRQMMGSHSADIGAVALQVD